MIGDITKNSSVSAYQPSQEVINFTADVKADYQIGVDILNKPWVELNNRSVTEDENRGQMMFNAFVDESVEDPNEAWKWRGTRSMARNKGIAMHAQLFAGYLRPHFLAQNENDEVDREFSEIIDLIAEWMTLPCNSNYQSSFLQVGFGMMTNPVTYLGADYFEVMQTIKEKVAEGKYEKKQIVDEVLSGFKAPVWSSSQILINNAYERDIQKQRRIIKRRFVEKGELEAKYGDHPNWPLVQAGMRSVYNSDDGLFYDVFDDEHPTLVAEETAISRRDDTEVCFLGGIYMGDIESVENNPVRHRDNRNAPKYNVVPFGYHRINNHFFYYKSMMSSLQWDNALYDAMSEIVMNRAILEVETPVVVTGSDKIDSDIIYPNSVVSFEQPDVKISPLLPSSNLVAGFNALRETEKSIEDGSVSATMSGQLPEASQKAYSVAQAASSAKKLIGAVGKSLAESVHQYGDLMKDIIVTHITVPQVEELTGGEMKLKYRNFLLKDKADGGKMLDTQIVFDESLIGKEMDDEETKYESLKLLEETGYPDNSVNIIRANPEMISKFKYLTRVDDQEIFTKNQDYWQPVLSNLYAQLRADPLIDPDFLIRKLSYAYFQSEGEGLIKKQPIESPLQTIEPTAETKGSELGNQVENKLLANPAMEAVAQ